MDELRRRLAAEMSGLGAHCSFDEGHPLLERRMRDGHPGARRAWGVTIMDQLEGTPEPSRAYLVPDENPAELKNERSK